MPEPSDLRQRLDALVKAEQQEAFPRFLGPSDATRAVALKLLREVDMALDSAVAWKDLAQKYEGATLYRCWHCKGIFAEGLECEIHFGARHEGAPTVCLQLEMEKALKARDRAESDSSAKDAKIAELDQLLGLNRGMLREEREKHLTQEGTLAFKVAELERHVLALRECFRWHMYGGPTPPPYTAEEALSDTASTAQAAEQRIREDERKLGQAEDLRRDGWSVAVHNDYRQNGESFTFWLFTKGNRCAKGEGRTDTEALEQVRAAILSDRAEPHA